jgi:hypothetical protein
MSTTRPAHGCPAACALPPVVQGLKVGFPKTESANESSQVMKHPSTTKHREGSHVATKQNIPCEQ